MSLSKSLWTKLVAVSLGATMALGIGLTASRVANEVNAADSITNVTVKLFNGTSGSSYITAANTDSTHYDVTITLNNFLPGTGQVRGNQNSGAGIYTANTYMFNTTTKSGYYIKSVVLSGSGATFTDAASRNVCQFGTSAFSTPTASLGQAATVASTSLTWTVANAATSNYSYFQINSLKTSGSMINCVVAITWAQAAAGQKTLTSQLEVSGSLTNATQYVGKTLDVSGLTIKAVYDDSSKSTLIASQLTLPTLVYGTNSYQISYTEGLVTATANIAVTVAQDSASSLSWTGRVTSFNGGSLFTLGAGSVTVTRASGDTEAVALVDLTIYLFSGTFNSSTSPVLAHATALQLADNGKSVVLGFEGVYTSASTISVNFVPTTTYGGASSATLVTSVSDLVVGNDIVISSTANSVALGAASGTYRTSVAVTISDNEITSLGSATILTLGGTTGAWTLSNGSDFLYFTGSSNTLQTGTSASSGNTWTIDISEGNDATIANVDAPTRKIQYNSGSPRFACYTTAQVLPQIYKLEGGYNYDYVLGMLDGDYCSATLNDLNTVVTRYDAMTASEKDYLNALTITGKDTKSYTGAQAYAALLARRSALQSQGVHTSTFGDNDNTSIIAIITILFVFGVAVGGYFYIRKKKSA